MSGTKRQRDKKNRTRVSAGELGYHSTTQHNYGKKKEENKNQNKLF